MDELIPVIAQLEGEPLGEGGLLEEVVLEEEHEEEGVFPPFDSTFFASQLLWLVITFVVLYLLMSRLVLPRIGGILEDRRDRIARDLDQADRLKQQADDAIASYERALAEAKAGAFTIAAERAKPPSRKRTTARRRSRPTSTPNWLSRKSASPTSRRRPSPTSTTLPAKRPKRSSSVCLARSRPRPRSRTR